MEERNIQVENLVILEKIGILKILPRLQDIYKATEWSKTMEHMEHIQTVKRILKAKFDNKHPYRFLLEYRYLLTFNMNYKNTKDNDYETETNCGADKSHKKSILVEKQKLFRISRLMISLEYKMRKIKCLINREYLVTF